MTERELGRRARRKLAVLRHVSYVFGVAKEIADGRDSGRHSQPNEGARAP